MTQAKLRVGLLLDKTTVPAWAFEMIKQIQHGDYAEICLLVVNDKKPNIVNKKLIDKIKNNKSRLGYLTVRRTLEVLYDKLIDRSSSLPDANAEQDIFSCLSADLERLDVKPEMKLHSDYFPQDTLEQIKEKKVDVLIRLGFRILRGGILDVAKYGVWSFHHGDNKVNRGGPAGYWESMQSWPETGSILQILSEDLDNGQVLYRSYSSTKQFSVQENINQYFWKTLYFIPRKLKELHRNGEVAFFEQVAKENAHPQLYSNRLFVNPTNKELYDLVKGKIREKFKHISYNRRYFDQWILQFDFRNDLSSSFWRYKSIIPPKDRFWADPHVIYRDNRYFVFIEEYLYSTHKGHISVMELKEDGSYSQPEVILDKDYHLSYPFVFEFEGKTYMIPESVENKTVELYCCTEFPNKWELVKNLMENVELLDATLYFQNGKWWMFANGINNPGMSTWDELYLFSSDDLLTGEWLPHPKNPIISDCKRSRPAGPIFEKNGNIYRPSQNSSNRYGYGFNINLIETLNENDYQETVVTEVTPNWSEEVLATHTFVHCNKLSMIDAQIARAKK